MIKNEVSIINQYNTVYVIRTKIIKKKKIMNLREIIV